MSSMQRSFRRQKARRNMERAGLAHCCKTSKLQHRSFFTEHWRQFVAGVPKGPAKQRRNRDGKAPTV